MDVGDRALACVVDHDEWTRTVAASTILDLVVGAHALAARGIVVAGALVADVVGSTEQAVSDIAQVANTRILGCPHSTGTAVINN